MTRVLCDDQDCAYNYLSVDETSTRAVCACSLNEITIERKSIEVYTGGEEEFPVCQDRE